MEEAGREGRKKGEEKEGRIKERKEEQREEREIAGKNERKQKGWKKQILWVEE